MRSLCSYMLETHPCILIDQKSFETYGIRQSPKIDMPWMGIIKLFYEF